MTLLGIVNAMRKYRFNIGRPSAAAKGDERPSAHMVNCHRGVASAACTRLAPPPPNVLTAVRPGVAAPCQRYVGYDLEWREGGQSPDTPCSKEVFDASVPSSRLRFGDDLAHGGRHCSLKWTGAAAASQWQRWRSYRMASKKVSHYQIIKKNRVKSSMRLDLFVTLNYESSTVILFVGIRYSMRYLLSDLNNYAWPTN